MLKAGKDPNVLLRLRRSDKGPVRAGHDARAANMLDKLMNHRDTAEQLLPRGYHLSARTPQGCKAMGWENKAR
jgi:hypothetical protein